MSYTISILRFRFIILHSNSYSRICINYLYQLFLFSRFDNTSSEKDFEKAAVAKGVGKSTGDETDDVHAKEKTAAAEKKAKIAAKIFQL